jgi:c-di-GMP-binding flagellar brake protein YcgR
VFFFQKKKKPERSNPLLKPPQPGGPAQKRTAFRMPVEFDIVYTLDGRRGRRNARANDLSAGGLRLSCDEDFLKGSILTLEFKLPDEFLANMTIEKEVYEQSPFGLRPESIKVQPHGFSPMTVQAKVLAIFFALDRKKFAHGLSFVNIDNKTQEELQRFIHLWQLNYIRTRRGDLG